MRFLHLLLLLIITCHVSAGPNDRYLSLPNPEKCKNRFKEFQYDGRSYFYSGHDKELKDAKLDWLDARNTCRERCMETVSFETQAEFDFIKEYIAKHDIKFIWTSGRLCDFAGCEGRWDLLPKIIKGWLWSANQIQIDETNKIPKGWTYKPWSPTGHFNRSQPDNAEFFINQATESCLGVLNNKYNDSVAWHDIACYHKTGFICEDSAELISEAQEIKEGSENSEEVFMAAPVKIETTKVETTSQKSKAASSERSTATTTRQVATSTIKPKPTATVATTQKPRVTPTEKATTTTARPTTAKQTTKIDALNTEVTSRFRPVGRRRPNAPEVLTTTPKATTTTTTKKVVDEEMVDVDEPEMVTDKEEIVDSVSIPEMILDTEEILPVKAVPTTQATTTEKVVSTTRRAFLRRKQQTERVQAVETTTKEAESNPRRFLWQRKKAPARPIAVKETAQARKIEEEPTTASSATSEEPKTGKKYSFLRKKLYGKGKLEVGTTEKSINIPTTTAAVITESSSESAIIVNDADLQKIDETTTTEALTTQATSSTQEVTTEEPSEPTRAIPIKRKKVKIYRKVIKLRTSTENVLLDGPSQDIDDPNTSGEYASTVIPAIPFKNLFKPRFRPSRLRFQSS